MDSFQPVVMIIPLALLIGLSFLVGRWADSKGQSFWLGFLLSIFVSPIVGAIVVAVLPSQNRW